MRAFDGAALIVFLRAPEIGKVKSRLAATLGDQAALEIYKELSAITMHLAEQVDMPVYIYYEGDFNLLLKNPGFHYRKQRTGNLGDRIEHAINEVLLKHHKAIIIGSDCPGLSHHDLIDTSKLLDTHDYVFGPAEDGGFYLMGCRSLHHEIFKGIPWGTGSVLASALLAVRQHEKTYSLLRKLQDIDTGQDWKRYKEKRD